MIQSTLYKYNTQEKSTTNLAQIRTYIHRLTQHSDRIEESAGTARIDGIHLQQLCIGPTIQISIHAELTEKRKISKSQSLTGLQRSEIGECLSFPMRYSSLERTLHLLQYQLGRSRRCESLERSMLLTFDHNEHALHAHAASIQHQQQLT